jgi:DNA repair protein RecN (Recombination protein N)
VSRARSHFLVEKADGEGVTSAGVRLLGGEARVEEIARMLGGDPESATSRAHARELLGAASGSPGSPGRSGRRTRSVS